MPLKSSLVLLLAGVVLVAGCGSTEPAPGELVVDAPPAPPATPPPSPSRPVVDLTFDVADDLLSVSGTERVVFTADLPTCRLVFRTWPNKPTTARTGNALAVTDASVDGVPVTPRVSAAGGNPDGPGTLVELPLAECMEPGDRVTAALSFTLTLGPGTDERVGVAPRSDVAWFGSAFPLLAWERGRGWATDAAVLVAGEMATSETFHLSSLRVEAAARHQVLGVGSAGGTEPSADPNRLVHTFSAPAVRDVTVTVGRLQTVDRQVDGVQVHVGGPADGTRAPLREWADEIEGAIRRLSAELGPFPYSELWVSVLPGATDGIELSGAIQFGDESDPRRWLVTHEVAHMWFHGLVGNNQARHPWLDEALATAAQRIADGESTRRDDPRVPDELTGQVGRPMRHWARFEVPSSAYVPAVYTAGGTALLEARRSVGGEAFDAALRSYLAENAHQIAEPDDLRRALADLPEAVQVLETAGAL